jgi:hypothetical protein
MKIFLKIHKKRHHERTESNSSSLVLNNNPSSSSNSSSSSSFSSPFAITNENKSFSNKNDRDETIDNHPDINISTLKIEATTNDVNNNIANKLADEVLAKQVNNISKSYWDRKSLPPTKRFKNYNQEEEDELALSKQRMENESNNQENIVELSSDSSMKDPRETPINDENKFSNNVSNDKASPEETRAQNDGENKLLGLANIALLRAKK